MSIIDKFKKKKKAEKKEKPVKKEIKAVERVKESKKEETALPTKARKKISGEAFLTLKTPHVTEKSTDLAGRNQYIFKVYPKANKYLVKKAVGEVFGVEVVAVRIINIRRKKRRLGRIEGWRKGYKKAIVRLKEGQKIEVLPR